MTPDRTKAVVAAVAGMVVAAAIAWIEKSGDHCYQLSVRRVIRWCCQRTNRVVGNRASASNNGKVAGVCHRKFLLEKRLPVLADDFVV